MPRTPLLVKLLGSCLRGEAVSTVKPKLLDFAQRLDSLHVPVSVAQLAVPDVPLLFVNAKFEHMTGYGRDALGRNCRFLQGDFDNSLARSVLSSAFTYRRQTQVILRNRKACGQAFSNLLFLGFAGTPGSHDDYVVGTQFNLGDVPLPAGGLVVPSNVARLRLTDPILPYRMVIERQRMLSETTLRLIEMLLLTCR